MENRSRFARESNQQGHYAQFIKGRLTFSLARCENCGSLEIIRNDSYTTHSQMLKDKEKLTILEVKRSRFLCHACGATIFAKIDLVDDHYQLTNELKHAILMELFENQSFKLINKKTLFQTG